jgi:8-oxo-dGTP pyrophosphatase MutT (NUDIX family)
MKVLVPTNNYLLPFLPVTKTQLTQHLHSYQTHFLEEKDFAPRFLELLKNDNAFQRTHLPGHITGSAWVVNKNKDHTLLVHHTKLDKWLQPGGHADGDENILAVALREAQEETGITSFNVHPTLFDIDVHTIPARADFPQHEHYDIRFLLEPAFHQKIIVSEESIDVKWVALKDLDQYTNEKSVLRMRDKSLWRNSL